MEDVNKEGKKSSWKKFFAGKPYYIANSVFVFLIIIFAVYTSITYNYPKNLNIKGVKNTSDLNDNHPKLYDSLRTQYAISLMILFYIFFTIIYRVLHSFFLKPHHNYSEINEKEENVMYDTTEKWIHYGTCFLGIVYASSFLQISAQFSDGKDLKNKSDTEPYYLNVTNGFMGAILFIFSIILVYLTYKMKDGYYDQLGEELSKFDSKEFQAKLEGDLQKEMDKFEKKNESLETQITGLKSLDGMTPDRKARITRLEKIKADNDKCIAKLKSYKTKFKTEFANLDTEVLKDIKTQDAREIIREINKKWQNTITDSTDGGSGGSPVPGAASANPTGAASA